MSSSNDFTERSHYFIAFMLKYEPSDAVKNTVLSKYITIFPDNENSYVRLLRDSPSINVHQLFINRWFEQNDSGLQLLNGGKFLILKYFNFSYLTTGVLPTKA